MGLMQHIQGTNDEARLNLTLHNAVDSVKDTVQPPMMTSERLAELRAQYGPLVPQNGSADHRGFPVKCLNIVDPLLSTNNLGRSVSRSSFTRIRGALTKGAKELTAALAKVSMVTALDCSHASCTVQ